VYLVLFALAGGFGSMFTFVGQPSTGQCLAQVLLPSLSFALVFGLLLAKVNRLYRIIDDTSLLSTPIKSSELLLTAGVVFAVQCVVVAVWLGADRPEPQVVSGISTGGDYVWVCRPRHASRWILLGIECAYAALVLVAGIVLSFLLRKIHNRVLWGESRYISFCFYVGLVAVVIDMAIAQVLYRSYEVSFVVTEAALFLGTALVLVLLFWSRVYIVFFVRTAVEVTAAADFKQDFSPAVIINPPSAQADDL